MHRATSRLSVAVALAALVLTAGCLGSAAPVAGTGAVAEKSGDDPTLSVSASGQVERAPDLAVVAVSVVAEAEDADAARAAVAADAEAMVAALRGSGLADDEIRSTAFNIYPVYDRDRETPTGYRAVHAYALHVAPEDAGAAVDTAVTNGATRVGAVRFTLAEDTRNERRTEAIRAAVRNARADADAVAAAANLSVVEVLSASTGSVGYPSPIRAEGAAVDAATSFEPGPVTVSATVSVVYRVSNGSSGS
jgi:uncharacterized protein YggE